MAHRSFTLIIIVGGFLLFAFTMAANLVLDPEAVFGTNLFPASANRNERYERLQAYKRDRMTVDGLLFSSSRGVYLDNEMLAKKMGVSHLLSLSVSYGMITDHLPILAYILRDKAAQRQKLRAVMLLLDADFFGKSPWTNSNINSFLPPELTGESPLRYWWRYLTVFQFRLWRDVVRSSLNPKGQSAGAAMNWLPMAKAANISNNDKAPIGDSASPARASIPAISEEYRRHWNSIRPDFDRQYAELEEFVTLCRDNSIQLTVAMSPLIRQNLNLHEPGTLDGLASRLSRLVSIWDFNSSSAIADEQAYWLDVSHFDLEVGKMMIGRMFDDNHVTVPADFGRLRSNEQR
jgi:hypothetical protein